MKQEFKTQINNTENLILSKEQANKMDAISVAKNKWHILDQNHSYLCEIVDSDFEKKTYKIIVNSNLYEVEIKDALDLQIEAMGFSSGNSKKLNFIKAPMPGIIISVLVQKNDLVKEGDTLLILEAMKMENAIICPKDAKIKAIHIATADTVDKGKLLIELE